LEHAHPGGGYSKKKRGGEREVKRGKTGKTQRYSTESGNKRREEEARSDTRRGRRDYSKGGGPENSNLMFHRLKLKGGFEKAEGGEKFVKEEGGKRGGEDRLCGKTGNGSRSHPGPKTKGRGKRMIRRFNINGGKKREEKKKIDHNASLLNREGLRRLLTDGGEREMEGGEKEEIESEHGKNQANDFPRAPKLKKKDR